MLLFASSLVVYYAAFVRATNAGLTFDNELRIPPELLPRAEGEREIYELTAGSGETEFVAGRPARTAGYNGSISAPLCARDAASTSSCASATTSTR